MENLPTILTEIDEIETVMRTDRALYNRSEPMQARYRGLLEQKAGASILDEDSTSGPLLPIASMQEFAAATGSSSGYSDYVRLSRTTADWIFAMPPSDQADFVARFEALPDEVTDAALAEMVATRPMATSSSGQAVAAFAELPEGAVLIREWGEASGRNLAMVRARLFRIDDQLDDGASRSFRSWLDGLSTNSAIALYRKLAG